MLLELLSMTGVPWASPGSHRLVIWQEACREPHQPLAPSFPVILGVRSHHMGLCPALSALNQRAGGSWHRGAGLCSPGDTLVLRCGFSFCLGTVWGRKG